MAHATRKLHPDFGIEIEGCDLSAPLCIGRTRTTTARSGPYFLAACFLALSAAFAMRVAVFLAFALRRRVCTVLEWLMGVSGPEFGWSGPPV